MSNLLPATGGGICNVSVNGISGGSSPEDANDETPIIEVIASLADAVGVYCPSGGEHRISAGRFKIGHSVPALMAAMQALAAEVTRTFAETSIGRGGGGAGTVKTRNVAVEGTSYRLRAIRIPGGFFAADPCVLVVVDRVPLGMTPALALRGAFGLTKREAEVAVLLGMRRSNAEIARVLGMSTHTARHHTGRILARLGVETRRDVEGVVEGLLAVGEALATMGGGEDKKSRRPTRQSRGRKK